MCVACRRLRAACRAIAEVGLDGLMVMPVLLARELVGEVPERLNGHAWKACVGRPTAGSNPVLSARNVWDACLNANCWDLVVVLGCWYLSSVGYGVDSWWVMWSERGLRPFSVCDFRFRCVFGDGVGTGRTRAMFSLPPPLSRVSGVSQVRPMVERISVRSHGRYSRFWFSPLWFEFLCSCSSVNRNLAKVSLPLRGSTLIR